MPSLIAKAYLRIHSFSAYKDHLSLAQNNSPSHNKLRSSALLFKQFFQKPPHQSKMSVPNNSNQGILGQTVDSVKNAANYVSETIQGNASEASKEANKQQAKGNVPGQDSLSDRASGAFGAVSDKLDQTKHEGSAEANKRSI
jgi:hypothetical protein